MVRGLGVIQPFYLPIFSRIDNAYTYRRAIAEIECPAKVGILSVAAYVACRYGPVAALGRL